MRTLLMCIVAAWSACAAGASEQPPNILMIVVDDLRADHLRCAGHPLARTPHIDALAARGTRFRQSFVITPLCGPSRATMLTGLGTYQHGVTNNARILPTDARTIVSPLKQAGYRTGLFGRYHNNQSSAPAHGFDHWFAFDTGGHNRVSSYRDPWFNVNGVREQRAGYSTDLVAQEAAKWVIAEPDRPFFALITLKSVHVPFDVPARHARRYARRSLAAPESWDDPLENLPRAMQRTGETRERPLLQAAPIASEYRRIATLEPGDPLENFQRAYLRMVLSVDDAVEALVDAVQRSGQADRTIVVFTADNGMCLGEKGIIGKEVAYEPSLRVPLIVVDPRVRQRSVADELVTNLDWAPTLLDWAGAEPAADMRGRSLRPLLVNELADWRSDWLMVSHSGKNPAPFFLAVRGTRWKYIRYVGRRVEEELFDLDADPGERQNLATSNGHAETLRQMQQRMQALLAEEGLPADWWLSSRKRANATSQPVEATSQPAAD